MKKFIKIFEEFVSEEDALSKISKGEDPDHLGWTNKDLNEDFWKDKKFDKSIQNKLVKIAREFYATLEFKAPIEDIELTGSLANYNFTDYSDLDVHIIIDFSKEADPDLAKKAADGKRLIWNLKHNIVIRGHDVEVYIQDINEKHLSSGLWSLLKGEWIAEPEYSDPKTDPKDVEKKSQGYMYEIDELEKKFDSSSKEELEDIFDRLGEVKSKIMKDRKEGLNKPEQEYSVENLAFKVLRNNGYMEKLIDLYNKVYDKIYSE